MLDGKKTLIQLIKNPIGANEVLKTVDKDSNLLIMALRLKYAGVEKIKIINDIEKAVEYIGKTADNNITILPTYTALLKLNRMRILKKCY